MDELLQVLAAGGDVGIWAVFYVIWRFDRRLLKLEMKVGVLPDDVSG